MIKNANIIVIKNTSLVNKDQISLYKYLQKQSSNKYFTELLQYEINKRVYFTGDNFLNPWGRVRIKVRLIHRALRLASLFNIKSRTSRPYSILSNVPFNWGKGIIQQNFRLLTPIWTIKKNGRYLYNLKYYLIFNKLQKIINNGGIQDLCAPKTISLYEEFVKQSKLFISRNNIVAGVFDNDLGFFERLYIDLLKKMNILTFIFLHGLPGRYNSIDDNRTDYLIVWGEQIKQNYINNGVIEDKIIVSGHPNYNNFSLKGKLRFELKNILVITKAINGAPSSSNHEFIENRGVSIQYLLSIKNCLMKIGISSVKLRLHPSENPRWYLKHLNDSFFKIDSTPLPELLRSSSLVIGPTSTVFLEALYYGVNYLVFEPIHSKNPLVNPFDGSNRKIPVAKNESDLFHFIKNKITVKHSVFSDYISPDYNFDQILEYIQSQNHIINE